VANKAYIERLQQVIFHLHKADAKHVGTVPVEEIFRGQTLWKGDVEVFDLTGHPEGQTLLRLDLWRARGVYHHLGTAAGDRRQERGESWRGVSNQKGEEINMPHGRNPESDARKNQIASILKQAFGTLERKYPNRHDWYLLKGGKVEVFITDSKAHHDARRY
jgi:hypothetical protein